MEVDYIILRNFIVALALGVLIGLEREYARKRGQGHTYAGIRTFPLISLFGALAAYLGETVSVWILIGSMMLMGTLILIAYFFLAKKSLKYLGATSELAGFLTFFVGVMAYYGELTFTVALAVIITFILYARSVAHHFARNIKTGELRDTILFAVIAFVILPFLPNQAYGPNGLFNPYIVWLMIVFISGISFVGYIFMKWFGERGIEISAIFGGLVSSTAVTTSFAQRSKGSKRLISSLLLGVILANTLMFIRILIEVSVINRELFYNLLIPLSILIVLSIVMAFVVSRKSVKTKGKISLGSPFTLGPALKFGAFFAVILALVKLADVYLSSKGVYVVSFISGLADVDAITVSLSQLAGEDLAMEIAQRGIMIAAMTNVAVKGGIAYVFGRKEFGQSVIVVFSVLILAGIGLMFLF